MMADKKIAVHVTNEEDWNEVREYYGNGGSISFIEALNTDDVTGLGIARTSDNSWGSLRWCKNNTDEYELL